MKHKAKFLALLAMATMVGNGLFAQPCTPDPACVDDDGKPGQFCPLDLPKGAINVLYDETVTVIPPGSFAVEGYGEVTILQITVDSVKNMPVGIDYTPNADIFLPGTAYCIQLHGTPTEVGKDTLAIYITATVDLLGGIEVPVVDDTSVVITIEEFVGIDPQKDHEFQVFQNVPNPFSEQTRLRCFVPAPEKIELHVYNILGVLVHHETEMVPTGAHSFQFNGKALEPGTYFYRVDHRSGSVSGKLVKTR